MEVVQTQPTYPRGLTFEQVWAALMEDREQMKELRESQKETGRILKETEQFLKESSANLDKKIGSLTNLFGEVAEYMIVPGLQSKFKEMGIDFNETARDTVINDYVHNIHLEIDVFLKNSDKVMLVEVKTKLNTDRINKQIERLEKMRIYADLHGDKRTFLGAVAGVVLTEDAKTYALNQGLYVIEPSGESFNITPPNGKPKEW